MTVTGRITKDKVLWAGAGGLVFLGYMALRWPYISFVPIWDGYIYFEALLRAVEKTASLRDFITNFNFFGHPAMGYGAILAAGQRLDPGNPAILNAMNIALSVLAVVLFYRILAFFFLDARNKAELWLIALLLAVNPLFFGASINFNLDFPVFVFFIGCLWAFLYGRFGFLLLFSVLLVFSKESGVLLYALFLAFLFLLYIGKRVFPRGKPVNLDLVKILRFDPGRPGGQGRPGGGTENDTPRPSFNLVKSGVRFLFLIAPGLLVAVYMLVRKSLSGSVFWENPATSYTLKEAFLAPATGVMLTRLCQIFVLNFQWLMTVALLLALIKRYRHRKNPQLQAGAISLSQEKRDLLKILFYVFLFFTLFFLKYQTFANPRYILPTVFFILLFFYHSLVELFRKRAVRLAVLAVILVLSSLEISRTVDPLSKAAYGTFDFGDHKMLKVVSITEECCGLAGRDQLVYNAEYTVIDKLIGRLYKDAVIRPETDLILDNYADFYIFTPIDVREWKRTMKGDNIFQPKTRSLLSIQKEPDRRPGKACYVNLPWMERAEVQLPLILEYYDVLNMRVVRESGYEISVYELVRRETVKPPAAAKRGHR